MKMQLKLFLLAFVQNLKCIVSKWTSSYSAHLELSVSSKMNLSGLEIKGMLRILWKCPSPNHVLNVPSDDQTPGWWSDSWALGQSDQTPVWWSDLYLLIGLRTRTLQAKTAQTFIFPTNLTFNFHDQCGFSCCRLFRHEMLLDTPQCTQNNSKHHHIPLRDHHEHFLKRCGICE